MRVIFMGTPRFAAESLRALVDAGHEIAGVWTRADKARGRGHEVHVSPVKALAVEHGFDVYQPATLRAEDASRAVAVLSPDVVCVAAYGLILPPAVLRSAARGCVNVHASLLPRYRGAAPIHRAVMAGERVTGITTMMMDEGLDTGDILLKSEEPIGPDETTGEVEERLAGRGAALLVETLKLLEESCCPRIAQDESAATYARPVRKDECRADWTRAAIDIHNMVRGTNPTPGAYTTRQGEPLRLHRSRVLAGRGEPGALHVNKAARRLEVGCGEGLLELVSIQAAGKRAMPGYEYALGRPIRAGEVLGDGTLSGKQEPH